MVKYVSDSGLTVERLFVDTYEQPNPYASGYGRKIPTSNEIKLSDGRYRRVYVMCYGNSGNAYVLIKGEVHFLNSDIEHALQGLRAHMHTHAERYGISPSPYDESYRWTLRHYVR